jgi:hypothetical protein
VLRPVKGWEESVISDHQASTNMELLHVFPYFAIFAGRFASILKDIWKLWKLCKQHFSPPF